MAAVTYAPGSWLGMIGPNSALLAQLDPGAPAVARCWELIAADAELDLIAEALIRPGLRTVPGFALARWADGALEAIVRGDGEIGVAPDAVSGRAVRTWVERSFDTIPAEFVISGGGAGPGPSLRVNGGIVLAGSLTIAPGAAADPTPAAAVPSAPHTASPAQDAAAAAAWLQPPAPAEAALVLDPGLSDANPGPLIEEVPWRPGPLPEGMAVPTMAAPEPPFGAGPAGAGHTVNRSAVEARAPEPALNHQGPGGAPLVPAAVCPYGHLNPPYGAFCRVCGTAIAPQEPVLAPRPVLGILRMSTGDVVPLDRAVIMGRNPRVDERDPRGPHVVKLPSPTNDISRSHVEVSLDDWHVVVADLNSTNGTTVTAPGQAPVRLRPHEPIPIEPNTEVNLADEVVFRFEVTE